MALKAAGKLVSSMAVQLWIMIAAVRRTTEESAISEIIILLVWVTTVGALGQIKVDSNTLLFLNPDAQLRQLAF